VGLLDVLLGKELQKIMANQAELAAQLSAVSAQLAKASGEIVARVAALEQAIANAGNSTPEVDAALEAVKQIAQALDDLNPDAA
jgi:ABC-type transporter Mla subunit MlaD